MRRRVATVLGLVGLLAVAAQVPASAQESAPEAAGWWQVGPLALVTGAGLEEGQLLVEGLGEDEGSRQAVAALSFALSGEEATLQLTVPVAPPSVPGATVTLCAITAPFEPAEGGAADDVPAHDCSRSAVGTVDEEGVELVVPDVGSLGDGEHLRVLLAPAQPGRIVLDGAAATLRSESGSLEPAPVVPTPGGGGFEPPPFGGPSAPATGSGQLSFDPLADPAPPGPVATPAAPDTPGAPTPAPTTTAAYSPPASDFRARLVTGLILAAALGAYTTIGGRVTTRLRPASIPWTVSHVKHHDLRR